MELLKLSKFKLQLRALISEVRDLRERERSANDQLRLLNQKQKQSDEENGRKLQELQNELALSNEVRQKLERKMSHLQDENALLETKHKELQATIQSLVQSRDDFLHAYEESTCEMRRSIEAKDRKITVLIEKVNSHFLLFDSIEKEACSIKRVVDNVQHVVSEKEELASSLKCKLEKVLSLEKVFVEKVHGLESKIERTNEDLKRKDRSISELEVQLEEAKMGNKCETHVQELQKILLAKDETVQNLLSEKKGLLFELGSLTLALQKVQDTFTSMNKQDKRKFSSILGNQEECYLATMETNGNCLKEDAIKTSRRRPPDQNVDCRESPLSQERKPKRDPCQDNNNAAEFFQPLSESACSGPQTAAHAQSISVNDRKDSSTLVVEYMDSECSTTQAETSRGEDRKLKRQLKNQIPNYNAAKGLLFD